MRNYIPFPGAYLAPVRRRLAVSTLMNMNQWPFGLGVQGVGNGVNIAPLVPMDKSIQIPLDGNEPVTIPYQPPEVLKPTSDRIGKALAILTGFFPDGRRLPGKPTPEEYAEAYYYYVNNSDPATREKFLTPHQYAEGYYSTATVGPAMPIAAISYPAPRGNAPSSFLDDLLNFFRTNLPPQPIPSTPTCCPCYPDTMNGVSGLARGQLNPPQNNGNGGSMNLDTALAILSGVTVSGQPVDATPDQYDAAWHFMATDPEAGGFDISGSNFRTPQQFRTDYAATHPVGANGSSATSSVLPLLALGVAAWFLLKK